MARSRNLFGPLSSFQTAGLNSAWNVGQSLPPEKAIRLQDIERRQQMANLLAQQAFQVPQVKEGKILARPSGLEYGASLGTALAGAYGNYITGQERNALTAEIVKNRKDAMDALATGLGPRRMPDVPFTEQDRELRPDILIPKDKTPPVVEAPVAQAPFAPKPLIAPRTEPTDKLMPKVVPQYAQIPALGELPTDGSQVSRSSMMTGGPSIQRNYDEWSQIHQDTLGKGKKAYAVEQAQLLEANRAGQGTPISPTPLEQTIMGHEGMVLEAYPESNGSGFTIGAGHHGKDVKSGMKWTQAEAMAWLRHDVIGAQNELSRNYEWYNRLPQAQKDVVAELHFNVGGPTFSKFKDTQRLLAEAANTGDFTAAANHLRTSTWAKQVGKGRANDMAQALVTGAPGQTFAGTPGQPAVVSPEALKGVSDALAGQPPAAAPEQPPAGALPLSAPAALERVSNALVSQSPLALADRAAGLTAQPGGSVSADNPDAFLAQMERIGSGQLRARPETLPPTSPKNQFMKMPDRLATMDEQDRAISDALGNSDPIVRQLALEREHVMEKRAERKEKQDLNYAKIEGIHADNRLKADAQVKVAEIRALGVQAKSAQMTAGEGKDYNDLYRTLQDVRDAIRVTTGGDVGSIRGTKNPGSIFYNLLPKDMIQFFNPDDAAAQIPVGQLVSNITKLMSGTAVSKNEMERLTVWLPRAGDLNSIIHQKLENFERELSRTIKDRFTLDSARGKRVQEFAHAMGFEVADREAGASPATTAPMTAPVPGGPALGATPAPGGPVPLAAPVPESPGPVPLRPGKPLRPGEKVEQDGYTISMM